MCPCACGHVRASVCHYYFVMLMCTIFILTITVQFGMDIMILGKYGIVFKISCTLVNVVMQSNIKAMFCQFKKLVIILLVIFYNRLV